MDRYLEMQTFAAVVRAGSFVNAADALGMSKAAVSRHVSDLESRLGVRLLQRTTRRLSLTEEGEVFFARCEDALSHIDEAEAEVTSRSTEAVGLLKISCPVSFGNLHLATLWGEFAARHPKVTLDITLSDRFVDLIEEGFDAAIRIARLQDSSMVGRKLSQTRMVLCASPKYLKKNSKIRHPDDLRAHSVIAYSNSGTADEWTFEGPEGTSSVKLNPRLRSNSGDTCRVAALANQGVIYQPTFLIGRDLAEGRLIEVLADYKSVELGIFALYPTRRFVSPKVRMLIDFLVHSFANKSWT